MWDGWIWSHDHAAGGVGRIDSGVRRCPPIRLNQPTDDTGAGDLRWPIPQPFRRFSIANARRSPICAERSACAGLELFGSAAAGRFVEGQSDFDFLVTFRDDRVKGVARLYLGLAEGLEQLLGGPVDLVTPESIRNPYFRQTIDATRRLIYED